MIYLPRLKRRGPRGFHSGRYGRVRNPPQHRRYRHLMDKTQFPHRRFNKNLNPRFQIPSPAGGRGQGEGQIARGRGQGEDTAQPQVFHGGRYGRVQNPPLV
jgi:hypothetical protein